VTITVEGRLVLSFTHCILWSLWPVLLPGHLRCQQ